MSSLNASAYYQAHRTEIKQAFQSALGDAVAEEGPDPVWRIGQLLQQQRTQPRRSSTNHIWAVSHALDRFRQSIGGLSQPQRESMPPWDSKQWLDSLGLINVILKPLLAPLKEKEPSTAAELPFFHAIGQLQDHTDLLTILSSHNVLEEIAKVMWSCAKELWENSGVQASSTQGGGSSKFAVGPFDAADGQISLGKRSLFFKGLDDFIGPPNPNVREAMHHEHCTSQDSTLFFTAINYQTRTTPRCEWYFVVDPTPAGLKKSRITESGDGQHPLEWPKEGKPPLPDKVNGAMPPGSPTKQRRNGRTLADAVPGPRQPNEMIDFEVDLNIKNGLLRDIGEEPMTWDEFIGSRLYTGPMFQKYNWVLRCIGNLRVEQPSSIITESEIEKKLSEDKVAATKGNVYTTTLHVINSACIKLGKLTSAAKVYRGIYGRSLPLKMHQADHYNVKGGVEFGFMSATLDRRVAIQYASSKRDNAAILFEMQMGMIDRGADLSWLSQYPHEREVLFAPLSALEVLTQHVEGQVCVVSIRLSVNLQALTIEQVVSKMQRSHLQLIDLLQGNMRFAGVPPSITAPLQQLRLQASHKDPSYYNVAQHYREDTNRVLDAQKKIFDNIADMRVWATDEGFDRKAKMRRTAMLCASVGEHGKAADLLTLWSGLNTRNGTKVPITPHRQKSLTPEWDLIAESLIKQDGMHAPWPGTLVELIKRGKMSGKLTAEGNAFIGTVQRMVEEMLRDRHPPFSIGADVLVLLDEEQIWEHARISRVRDGIVAPLMTYTKWGKRREGEGYEVTSWKTRVVQTAHVLAPGMGGPAALLRHAAEMGEVELVDALLKAGVSVYESDAQANTALILAAKNGHADVCRLLKSQGADEHVRNAFRENAYDLANNSRRMDVLRVFNPWASDLDVGFQGNSFEDKKAKNTLCEPCDLSNGVTMLMLACRQGDIDAVREILDARQDDPLARTSSGCTALTMASEEGGEAHVHVVEELLRRCQAEYSFPVEYLLEQYLYSGRKTAMVLAATNGHLEVVKLLANARANINVRTQRMQFIDGARVDGDRRTVLHLTCMHGHHDVASFLIDNKADINATNYSGDTPLMLAARYGHSQVVKLLLRSNCTVADETMAPSWSSMHRACGAGHVDVAEALLEAHEEFVNHKDKKGLTPLMAAVSANFSEGAVILMNKGANVHERDHEGRSAVFYAAMAGQEKSLRVLLTAHNIQVDQPDSVGETPLMAACKSGHESTARLLLNAQANLEAPDDVAPNPLIIAAAAGHEPIVRMLLNNGAHRRKEKAAEEAMKASKSREGADVHGALNPTPLTRTDSSMSSGGTERFHKIIELLKREPMSP